jgi:hypothetical protein
MSVSFVLVSDAMRANKRAQEAVALVMRSMPSDPCRDALSAALQDMMMSQTSLEALRAKLSVTPRPVLTSPTAGN